MGMLFAEGLAGLKTLTEALLENTKHRGNSGLVACARLRVLQRHPFDLPAIPQKPYRVPQVRLGMRQVKAAVQLRLAEDFIPTLL
jgi:hypothetical protein